MPASFLGTDTTTTGFWPITYGSDGYILIGDVTINPSYCTPTTSGTSFYSWFNPTADARGVYKPDAPFGATENRIAACWYGSSMTIDLPITDSATHKVAVYCLDWDHMGRGERIDVLDSTGTVLDTQSVSSFTGGIYFVWQVSGHVKLRVNVTAGSEAVISALFFDTATTTSTSTMPTNVFTTRESRQGILQTSPPRITEITRQALTKTSPPRATRVARQAILRASPPQVSGVRVQALLSLGSAGGTGARWQGNQVGFFQPGFAGDS